MNDYKVQKLGQRWVLFNPAIIEIPTEENFSCKKLQQQGRVTGKADGRGETCFYKADHSVWALRHYLRGGLVARLLHDQYFGFRLKNTRAWKEWHLLNDMTRLGLPVPRPVAASVIKSGIFYRADLVTEYIDETNTLADRLQSEPLDKAIWKKIGDCIKQFHDKSVFHSDLNAKNILLDAEQKIYLIDFDQCGLRKGEDWKQENLSRLKRSLEKFKSKQTNFNFDEAAWESLIIGYNGEA